MDNNYEEIYDQAGFFAEIWDQLPEEFTKGEEPVSPWGTAITSHSMVFIDFSDDVAPCLLCNKLSVNGICENCLSKNDK